jgi:hypothetical protein
MKFFVLTLSGRSKGNRDVTGTQISVWKWSNEIGHQERHALPGAVFAPDETDRNTHEKKTGGAENLRSRSSDPPETQGRHVVNP